MQLQRFLLLLLLLVTAVIGIYAAYTSSLRPYIGVFISFEGDITFIDPKGPAAISGILSSDIIRKIDGAVIDTTRPFYEGVKIGEQVHLEIQRSGDLFEYNVTTTATPPYALANKVMYVTLGIIFWGFGFFLFLRNHPKFTTIHFVIFLASVATALFALEDAEYGYLWARYTMYCTLAISGAAWLNVHRNFPVAANKIWQKVCDFCYVLATLITFATLSLSPVTLTQIATQFGFSPLLPSNIIRLVWSVECIAGLYLLIQGYRSQAGDTRRRVRFVTIGSLVGLVPVATILIAEAVRFYSIPNTIALTGLIALPITYSISLTQTDIIRLETQFYRTLIIITLVILVPLMYLGLFSIINWLEPSIATSPIIGALIALLLAVIYSRVHSEVESLFRRIFFGEKPNHFKQLAILTNALKKLSNQLDEETVISLLTKKIPAEINVNRAGLWFVTNNSLMWRGGELTEYPRVFLEEDFTALRDSYAARPHLFQSHDSDMASEVRWWIPLVTSEKGESYELHGLWLLGPRHNDESFSPSDVELINATAQESALAVKAIRLLADLRQQLEQTEKAWNRTIRIREDEQRRIANDLHDDVIQLIYFSRLHLQSATQMFIKGEDPTTLLEKVLKDLGSVSEKTRMICNDLRPDALTRLCFVDMLWHVIQQTESRMPTPFAIKLNAPAPTTQKLLDFEMQGVLDQQAKISLYRIIQEALNNVIKHSGATLVTITLKVTDVLSIEIFDDGRGFDVPKTLSTQHGLGLATIKTRASDVNATVRFESEIEVGTRIVITLPHTSSSWGIEPQLSLV